MAEIKSTMELVLERAARMGRASTAEIAEEADRKTGMQLVAAFLEGRDEPPAAVLARQETGKQAAIRRGMIEALLRNIFLPRDDQARERCELATRGLLELAGGAGDIAAICQDIQHIASQYGQHREQLRGQLEEQVRMQYEQVMAQQMGGQSGGFKIDPTAQPKFREEWARLEGELDGQYNQALNQHRDQLKQRLLG